ncbi:uncharacterized protein LOC128229039 [Mya arenaria]|uniref:uncharacterized protein LOC128229039 n=1 Tax=Mya arenaria TaxID=6604 RepID=UPI0022E293B2|nr:uncharacterized protein LOC128229039 [Mya arenaria]
MQTLLQTLLCFVFVAQCLSQPGTYSGRRRTVVNKPVVVDHMPIFNPKPINPKPIIPKPINQVIFGGENSAFGQGSFMGGSSELELIRKLQGSTQFGRILRAGEIIEGITLPEHGGTLEASGITADGRGAIIPGGLPKNVFNDGWQHPWGGNAIPDDYAGQELIFDQALGHYVYVKNANVGHQINKETHNIQKAVGLGQSVVPTSHNIAKSNMAVEHSIVKEADHIARKTVGGVQVVGGGMGFDPMTHNTIKTSGSGIIIAGKPTYQGGIIKSGGVDPVSHNIIKASAGAGFGNNPTSHNMIKASVGAHSGMSGPHIGGIGVDPITHDIAKSASIGTGGIGVDSFNHNIAKDSNFQHNMVKSLGVGHIGAGKPGISAGTFGVDQSGIIAHNIGKATMGADSIQGHNLAKASGVPIGSGFMNPGSHISRKAEAQAGHDFAKSGGLGAISKAQSGIGQPIGMQTVFLNGAQSGMDGRQIGGFGVDPITHNIAKSASVSTGGIGVDPFNHNIAKDSQFQHNMVKSSGAGGHIAAGKPNYDKGFIFGTVNQQGVIAHNIGKATMGADSIQVHNFAKASGVPIGNGFMGQGSHINRKEGHDFAKSGGMNGMNIFGQTSGSNFVHDMNKAQSAIGQPMGLGHMIKPVGGASVVHNVNKVGAGGAAGMGHDRLAAEVGHGIAKNSVANAAGIVDMGSGGAVSMGDPFANQAAARLAQESLHVAQKTVGMASNGGGAFNQPIMHKPVMPKKPVVGPTGYGGRTRSVRIH